MTIEMPGVSLERDVMVKMRDGTLLATDVYLPEKWSVPLPALVHRTPYGKGGRGTMSLMVAPEDPVAHGYAVVLQDTRGRGGSEGGVTHPFTHDIPDGYDAIEWVARQPWCNGNVGIYGSSGMGVTTIQAAASAPPHLKAAISYITSGNPYEGYIYDGHGALLFGFALHWAWGVGRAIIDHLDLPAAERAELHATIAQALEDRWNTLKHLPLTESPGLRGPHGQFWRDWLAHPTYDAYWQSFDALREPLRMPMLHIGAWYDVFHRGHLALQRLLQSGGKDLGHRFVAGPWDHRSYMTSESITGERDFGPIAISGAKMLPPLFYGWFDKWLKGGDGKGVPASAVRYFVMGTNEWREAATWPPPSRDHVLYLGGGKANTRLGDGTLSAERPAAAGANTFTYDPADPVPSVGGRTLHIEWSQPGIFDQREVELRPDVLVYTSAPLTTPLEIAGKVRVELHARTSAEDTDFTGKLVDVEPEGYCANLADGLVRARYREGTAAPSWIVPNDVVRYAFDLGDVAHTFRAGHRVRLEISSSNFPAYDRNLNSRVSPEQGGPADIRVAEQQLLHGGDTLSRVILPVTSRP